MLTAIAAKKENKCRCHRGCPACATQTVHELKSILVAIDSAIGDYVEAKTKEIQWGYTCKCISEENLDWLYTIQPTIQRYYDSIRLGVEPCLSNTEIQRVKERVFSILGSGCVRDYRTDVVIDRTGRNQWIVDHPSCVLYEPWEKAVCDIFPEFTIQVIKRQEECRVAFKIIASDITPELPKYIAVVEKARCEHKVSASATNIISCQTEFNIISKKKNCDFDINTYAKLLDCHMDHKIISTILDCGYKLRVNAKTGCAQIKIGAKVHDICDLGKVLISAGAVPEREVRAYINQNYI